MAQHGRGVWQVQFPVRDRVQRFLAAHLQGEDRESEGRPLLAQLTGRVFVLARTIDAVGTCCSRERVPWASFHDIALALGSIQLAGATASGPLDRAQLRTAREHHRMLDGMLAADFEAWFPGQEIRPHNLGQRSIKDLEPLIGAQLVDEVLAGDLRDTIAALMLRDATGLHLASRLLEGYAAALRDGYVRGLRLVAGSGVAADQSVAA